MIFVNWDRRPAVLFNEDDPPWAAFAVLLPGADWTSVDFRDVSHTGAVLSEAVWRARFEMRFGELDVERAIALHSGAASAVATE